MTDIEKLKGELDKVDCYPPGLEKVSCEITGKGFFPGARGLVTDGDEIISNKSIMILGHDFGTKVDYCRSKQRGYESQTALTWKNLSNMLVQFGIEEKDCFFTNAIMGVRVSINSNKSNDIEKKKVSAIGRSIAYEHVDYLKACKELLIKQIELQKPKLIIVLGLNIVELISDLSIQLNEVKNFKKFKHMDEVNKSSFKNVVFEKIPAFETNIAFITHPTYWHLNVKHRNINGLKCVEAESMLIKSLK